MEPIKPSIVFLGLMALANLCEPIAVPTKYAKVSLDHVHIKSVHISALPTSKFKLVSVFKASPIFMPTNDESILVIEFRLFS